MPVTVVSCTLNLFNSDNNPMIQGLLLAAFDKSRNLGVGD